MAQQPVIREAHVATGVTLRYLEQGDRDGPPILLLHPWAESLRCFDRLVALLPPTLRVLSLDQRGHGGSAKPAGGYELASKSIPNAVLDVPVRHVVEAGKPGQRLPHPRRVDRVGESFYFVREGWPTVQAAR